MVVDLCMIPSRMLSLKLVVMLTEAVENPHMGLAMLFEVEFQLNPSKISDFSVVDESVEEALVN